MPNPYYSARFSVLDGWEPDAHEQVDGPGQSKEEFDSLSKSEMKELEDVLRSSEEERRRLEMERGKEEELFSRALAVSNETEKPNQKPESLTATSSSRTEVTTPAAAKNDESKVTSDAAASKTSKTAEGSEAAVSSESTDLKPSRAATAKKDRRESTGERPPPVRTLPSQEKDRRASVGEKSPATKMPAPPEKTPPRTRGNGRPPTAKRANTPSGGAGERPALKSVKERRPSTEARKTKEDGTVSKSVGEKTEEELDEEGMMYGPRGKNIYDVNALLREPNRLNSATIRSREEYLRMQRDRLLAMKANEREKQMNEVSQRAAQERPRTARAARGLMRGSRGAIGNDDVLAARRAIVDQLKTEIEDSSTS
ncbi:hypothetical protein TELCIR_08989 [Teladorsagia circumcincta]|uniref:Uncharacterized protein n=1 Tax=Teladorsagia circumcincta TaxID=45464 RepID=A0A2G9UG25_TELCI|nr:hypothetical protein TELCIR_08989 [Teladorsagia circumcincta]